jgi:hypothetical protein
MATDEHERREPGDRRRFIQVVHALPGRARFRLPWLHDRRKTDEPARLGEELARLPGMREAEIRPFTGTVLCHYDPQRLDHAALVAELRRLTGVETTLGPSDRPPVEEPLRRAGPGEVAREVARLFKDLDEGVLAATDGKMDLGTVATFGFFAAGALNVTVRRKAGAPPWFILAWWGLRTFMLSEADPVTDAD